ncbi:ribonuclease HII [Polycladidibacter stylochi]|uniref:ribonuclease HII n=1 Tax=Polycladidibacter stylochi TaxID=1807766 RepID=UPI00082ADA9B|nr:ribonuclease HII [Pseudovibrio stylochi]
MTHFADNLFSIAFPDDVDIAFERKLSCQCTDGLIGIDEAGRGPWAGPVVVAAAKLDYDNMPEGLNDSKKLSEKKRDALYGEILEKAQVSVCVQSPSTIDSLNIRAATLQGMSRCARFLAAPASLYFIDGKDVPPHLPGEGQALIKGDGRCLAIAAASIVAKVTRDRIMMRLDKDYPQYGFAKHKGYGTKAHREALERFGISPHHRLSFRPMKDM